MSEVLNLEHRNDELEKLRNKQREEKLASRERQREYCLKKVRRVEDSRPLENIAKNDLTQLAKTLKKKSYLSCELLSAIMNGLLESQENITAFLNVDGALQALLRALSGQNEEFQLIAARCICNLALGKEKQTLQVLRASESYLMAHLTGRNNYLIEACVIALGNFSKHGLESIKLLQSQGFFPKIIHLMYHFDPAVKSSAVYALTQIIYYGYDFIELVYIKDTLEAVVQIFNTSDSLKVAFLMSLLSSFKNLWNCYSKQHTEVCITALHCLKKSLKNDENESVYFIRILSNSISEETGQIAHHMLKDNSIVLRECVKLILQSKEQYLVKEGLSLVGVLLNHPSQLFETFAAELVKENFNSVQMAAISLQKLSDQLT